MPKVARLISAVRMDGELALLLHASRLPLVGQFVADGDAAKAFFDPILGIAHLLVELSHPFGGEFGILDFLKTFVADLGEPELEWLGSGRGDG